MEWDVVAGVIFLSLFFLLWFFIVAALIRIGGGSPIGLVVAVAIYVFSALMYARAGRK